MTDEPRSRPCPAKPEGRRQSIYVYWGVALALLLTAGVVCWFVVVPVWQVRTVVQQYAHSGLMTREKDPLRRLGGPQGAAPKLALYLRLPGWLAPERKSAVILLGLCGESGAVGTAALAASLSDTDAGVRSRAAEALERIGPAAGNAIPALINAIDDENVNVRQSAIAALRSIGVDADRGVPAFTKALGDQDARIRSSAAVALGELKASEAVDPLIQALRDREAFVRGQAVLALGMIGPAAKRAIPALKRLESDEDTVYFTVKDDGDITVCELVAEALKKIKGSGPAPAPALSEKQKIERLLKYVAASGATFIRNDTEHPAAKAAEHLRGKWSHADERIKTARQFIDHLATRSSISGKPYKVRTADGREVPVGQWLSDYLKKLEAADKKDADK